MADTGGIDGGDRAERAGGRGVERDRRDDAERARALIEGLDAQAEALAALDDAVAAEELARAEIARTTWADRVRAVEASGGVIELELPDGQLVSGAVIAVLSDGMQLADGTVSWVIRAEAVHSITGVRMRTRQATRIEQRLSLGSVLRDWADERSPVQCVSARGVREGSVIRVGADHIDLAEHDRGDPAAVRRIRTIPMVSLWAVRRWQ